jgi:hypothetical protein
MLDVKAIVFNKSLDREPLLLSVIPPRLLMPIAMFFMLDAFIFFLWLKLPWIYTAIAFTSEIIIWLLLTSRGSYTLLSRLESPPYWVNTWRRVAPILPLQYVEFREPLQQLIQNRGFSASE